MTLSFSYCHKPSVTLDTTTTPVDPKNDLLNIATPTTSISGDTKYEITNPSGGGIRFNFESGDSNPVSPTGNYIQVFLEDSFRWIFLDTRDLSCISGPLSSDFGGGVNEPILWHSTQDAHWRLQQSFNGTTGLFDATLELTDLSGSVSVSVPLTTPLVNPDGNNVTDGFWRVINGANGSIAGVQFIASSPAPASGLGSHNYVYGFDRTTGALVPGTGFWIYNASGMAHNQMGNTQAGAASVNYGAVGASGPILSLIDWDGTNYREFDINDLAGIGPGLNPNFSHLAVSPDGTIIAGNPLDGSISGNLVVANLDTNAVLCNDVLSTALGTGFTQPQHLDITPSGDVIFSGLGTSNVSEGIWILDPSTCTYTEIDDWVSAAPTNFPAQARPSGTSNHILWHESDGGTTSDRICWVAR